MLFKSSHMTYDIQSNDQWSSTITNIWRLLLTCCGDYTWCPGFDIHMDLFSWQCWWLYPEDYFCFVQVLPFAWTLSIDNVYDCIQKITFVLSRFCHSCGSPFPMAHVRFCCQCGTKRLQSWLRQQEPSKENLGTMSLSNELSTKQKWSHPPRDFKNLRRTKGF